MADLLKGKVATGLVVIATIILASVAIFTALRLYQLRQESVSPTTPESEPAAWDCGKYTFSVNGTGVVTVNNTSSRSEPPQQAQVYINNTLSATFDVPALQQDQNATLGTVIVPSGTFSWRVVGTKDCSNSGTATGEPVVCELLTFTITEEPSTTVSVSPTVTPSITPTLTITPTPTEPPIGGTSPTPTQGPGPSSTSTPTPTKTEIAAASPTPGGSALPDAGQGTLTLFGFGLGFLLIVLALLLAI